MESLTDVKELLAKISNFKNLYQRLRVVDVKRKTSFEYDVDKDEIKEGTYCYKIWNKNKACENCISMRVLSEKKTIFKFEHDGEKIYLITAFDAEMEGRNLIFEFISEATDSELILLEKNSQNNGIINLVDSFNNKIIKDDLTKIYNRRYINERLPYEMIQAKLQESDLTIIMADIDFFKDVNDNYGHVAGDFVLKEFAMILQDNIPQDDGWVARYGGEEFLICIRKNLDEVLIQAEKMRKDVEHNIFKYKNRDVRITCSMGIKEYNRKSENLEEYIDKADINLYKAKNNGRNRVEY